MEPRTSIRTQHPRYKPAGRSFRGCRLGSRFSHLLNFSFAWRAAISAGAHSAPDTPFTIRAFYRDNFGSSGFANLRRSMFLQEVIRIYRRSCSRTVRPHATRATWAGGFSRYELDQPNEVLAMVGVAGRWWLLTHSPPRHPPSRGQLQPQRSPPGKLGERPESHPAARAQPARRASALAHAATILCSAGAFPYYNRKQSSPGQLKLSLCFSPSSGYAWFCSLQRQAIAVPW